MTKGVLIFAFNNSEIDYVSIAAYAAKRVKQFLNLPVSIVTDQSSYDTSTFENVFDKVIVDNDTSTQVKRFYNSVHRSIFLQWLPWLLRMSRPGGNLIKLFISFIYKCL